MDTDPVSFKEFDDYLRDLERINVLTLAYRPTLLWLKRALADFPEERPISVLDVGSGGGGMLRQLRKWARGKNLKLDLTGVDINPWSTRSAAESTPPEMSIRFEQPTSSLEWVRSEQILSAVRLSPITSETRIWFVLSAGWTVMPRTARSSTTCSVTSFLISSIKCATRFLPVNRMA